MRAAYWGFAAARWRAQLSESCTPRSRRGADRSVVTAESRSADPVRWRTNVGLSV